MLPFIWIECSFGLSDLRPVDHMIPKYIQSKMISSWFMMPETRGYENVIWMFTAKMLGFDIFSDLIKLKYSIAKCFLLYEYDVQLVSEISDQLILWSLLICSLT